MKADTATYKHKHGVQLEKQRTDKGFSWHAKQQVALIDVQALTHMSNNRLVLNESQRS